MALDDNSALHMGLCLVEKKKTGKLIQGEPERRGDTQKQSREMKELAEMRKRSLNTPLSEKAPPSRPK